MSRGLNLFAEALLAAAFFISLLRRCIGVEAGVLVRPFVCLRLGDRQEVSGISVSGFALVPAAAEAGGVASAASAFCPVAAALASHDATPAFCAVAVTSSPAQVSAVIVVAALTARPASLEGAASAVLAGSECVVCFTSAAPVVHATAPVLCAGAEASSPPQASVAVVVMVPAAGAVWAGALPEFAVTDTGEGRRLVWSYWAG